MKKKFLIIRFSSIGDIVLTTPVIRILKNQMEDAEVHFLTKVKHENLLRANPHINKIITLNNDFAELIDKLKNENYDYIIDLHNNIRTLKIKKAIKKKTFTFHKLNIYKWLLVNLKINKLPNVHIVDRYIDTLKSFNLQNDLKGLEYHIPEEDEFELLNLPKDFQDKYVAIILSGTYFTKRYPARKLASLLQERDIKFVLLGGSAEIDMAKELLSNAHSNVLNFAGKLNINESASIVKKAQLVITNDTGLMHIAAAFKKKILSIWGNTTPDLGMYPYLPNKVSKIIEVKELKCRPCSKLGKHQCPKGHFKCMMNISEPEIIDWVRKHY